MLIRDNQETQKRLKEIEARKINILLEIATINEEYSEKVLQLNSEFEQLHEEYYQLQIEMMTNKQKR